MQTGTITKGSKIFHTLRERVQAINHSFEILGFHRHDLRGLIGQQFAHLILKPPPCLWRVANYYFFLFIYIDQGNFDPSRWKLSIKSHFPPT